MLMARSGVYHTAAYEAQSMKDARPARGSHPPNTYWYYNNWDFNTLVTIFNQETGLDFFETFNTDIAKAIGMEDFRLSDSYYHYEYDNSIHPAYPFRMSARDLARFGLLVLKNGKWGDQQIVPPKWVEKMSISYSQTGWKRGGYGYMWWISGDEVLGKQGMYSAFGAGGHRVDVIPGEDVVFVFRVNTYQNEYVTNDKSLALLKMILNSKEKRSKKNPDIIILKNLSQSLGHEGVILKKFGPFEGEYKFESGYTCNVVREGNGLVLKTSMMGTFKLIPLNEYEFLLEDAEYKLVFSRMGGEKYDEVTLVFSDIDREPGWRVK